jgi:UDP-N-acetylglucosamine 4,6-dehydratase
MTRFWITLDQGVRFVLDAIQNMQGGEVFVPKIPSMRMTDLADAIAPGCERTEIGMRPGEKLHEVLLSEDEARHSVETDDAYIINPMHPWWKDSAVPAGSPLPEGFRYGSDNNSDWLTPDNLKALIGEPVHMAEAAQV